MKKTNKDYNPYIAQTMRENEQRANHLCCVVLMVASVSSVLNAALIEFGFFKLYSMLPMNIVVIVLISFVVAFNRLEGIKDSTLKFINIGGMILVTAIIDMVANYNASLVITIPIVMSSLYFSRRTVAITSAATIGVFGIETYIAARKCILLDSNKIDIPVGTVLEIKTTLKQAILDSGVDTDEYVHHIMTKSFVPKMVGLMIIIAAAIAVAQYGQRMLVRQANVTAEHTRIDTELSVANAIQAHALPDVADINGKYNFELASSMRVARETGGDFYDFTMLDDTHLAMVIADVSDKGVPAAMFMMSAKARLNSAFSLAKSPAQILAEVNNSLCANNAENMFVTVWLGIIDLQTGVLNSANAGHENPIVRGADGRFVEISEHHDVFLGIFEDVKYTENQLQLKSGDVLVQYTDGVTEARRSTTGNDMYGIDRLVNVLNEKCIGGTELSAEEIRRTVDDDIKAFVSDTEQSDDITMLIFKML